MVVSTAAGRTERSASAGGASASAKALAEDGTKAAAAANTARLVLRERASAALRCCVTSSLSWDERVSLFVTACNMSCNMTLCIMHQHQISDNHMSIPFGCFRMHTVRICVPCGMAASVGCAGACLPKRPWQAWDDANRELLAVVLRRAVGQGT